MPHCWPQKQQCVGTILSGSTLVSARGPSIRLRCGPHTLARTSCSFGSVAIQVLWGVGSGEWGVGDKSLPFFCSHSPLPTPHALFHSSPCAIAIIERRHAG